LTVNVTVTVLVIVTVIVLVSVDGDGDGDVAVSECPTISGALPRRAEELRRRPAASWKLHSTDL
jgi:hypothetical protein